jgi:hypothetical protein
MRITWTLLVAKMVSFAEVLRSPKLRTGDIFQNKASAPGCETHAARRTDERAPRFRYLVHRFDRD